ncbi:hypothetical protein BRADI_1g50815v3 [Brachypodium distachyon]|uniref:Uncharacterized protein n=1 Tax=Brachypodium distachyon TaxID=15368 RepID=A0A0Q3HBA7_BRADI|nr:hypothetical protein BRADI_1g50815v3 [Brachypodium distachyon]
MLSVQLTFQEGKNRSASLQEEKGIDERDFCAAETIADCDAVVLRYKVDDQSVNQGEYKPAITLSGQVSMGIFRFPFLFITHLLAVVL